jgi:hypothetical protein
MSFLLFILLILFLLIGWPLLRGWLYMNSLRRRVNESFRGRQQHERPRRDYEEEDDGKIFNSGDGEYAEYEEVSGTIAEETSSTGETQTIIEEQVIDAEFEDVNT